MRNCLINRGSRISLGIPPQLSFSCFIICPLFSIWKIKRKEWHWKHFLWLVQRLNFAVYLSNERAQINSIITFPCAREQWCSIEAILLLPCFLVGALFKAFLKPLQPVNYGLLYVVRKCFGKAWYYRQNCLKHVSAAKRPPHQ